MVTFPWPADVDKGSLIDSRLLLYSIVVSYEEFGDNIRLGVVCSFTVCGRDDD